MPDSAAAAAAHSVCRAEGEAGKAAATQPRAGPLSSTWFTAGAGCSTAAVAAAAMQHHPHHTAAAHHKYMQIAQQFHNDKLSNNLNHHNMSSFNNKNTFIST